MDGRVCTRRSSRMLRQPTTAPPESRWELAARCSDHSVRLPRSGAWPEWSGSRRGCAKTACTITWHPRGAWRATERWPGRSDAGGRARAGSHRGFIRMNVIPQPAPKHNLQVFGPGHKDHRPDPKTPEGSSRTWPTNAFGPGKPRHASRIRALHARQRTGRLRASGPATTRPCRAVVA